MQSLANQPHGADPSLQPCICLQEAIGHGRSPNRRSSGCCIVVSANKRGRTPAAATCAHRHVAVRHCRYRGWSRYALCSKFMPEALALIRISADNVCRMLRGSPVRNSALVLTRNSNVSTSLDFKHVTAFPPRTVVAHNASAPLHLQAYRPPEMTCLTYTRVLLFAADNLFLFRWRLFLIKNDRGQCLVQRMPVRDQQQGWRQVHQLKHLSHLFLELTSADHSVLRHLQSS